MKIAAYESYKPSGVEWLKQLPATWTMKRLKYVANRSEIKIEADEENPLPYIGLEHVESWTGRLLPLDEELVPTGISNYFKSGDTLFGKLRPYLAKACNVDFEGLCSSELLVLRGNNYEPRFLLYQLLCQDFINLVDSSTYGSKMPRANWDFIGSCELILPPLEEQQTIADFLDAQTARLDTLLAKKQQFIEKLKEKRNALATRTVTRGLPPLAAQAAGLEPYPAMKASEIEWARSIPEHWKVTAVWHQFFLGRGRVISHEDIADNPGEYPVYSSQTENDGVMGLLGTYDFEGEYITWTTDGANAGTVFNRAGRFNCTNVCGTLKAKQPDKMDNRYVAYTLCMATGEFVRHDINPKLMNNVMKSICFPLPPINEQRAIAAYLDRETARIDQLTSKVEAALLRLTESRQALITAAVPGKIDVRN